MKRKIDFLRLLLASFFLVEGGLLSAHALEHAPASEAVAQSVSKKADKGSSDSITSQPVQLNGDNVEYSAEDGKFTASIGINARRRVSSCVIRANPYAQRCIFIIG